MPTPETYNSASPLSFGFERLMLFEYVNAYSVSTLNHVSTVGVISEPVYVASTTATNHSSNISFVFIVNEIDDVNAE